MRALNIAYSISPTDNIFHRIKQLNTVDVARRCLSLELRRQGARWTGSCPIHADSNPSLVIFPNGQWHCFGCQEHGDAVNLVAQVLNLRPIDAAKLIAREFNLPVDRPLTPAARRQAEQQASQRELERHAEQAFNQQVDDMSERLELLVRTTRTTLARHGLPAYMELDGLVRRLPAWLHLLVCLRSRDVDTRIAALREARKNDG